MMPNDPVFDVGDSVVSSRGEEAVVMAYRVVDELGKSNRVTVQWVDHSNPRMNPDQTEYYASVFTKRVPEISVTDLGRYLEPTELAIRVSGLIGDLDGCVRCGYAFTYEAEGCDACHWVTEALKSIDRTTEKDS